MKYYVQINRRAFGPFEENQVRDMIRNGGVTRETLVSLDRLEWKAAGEFEELFPKPKEPQKSAVELPEDTRGNDVLNFISLNDHAFDKTEWFFSNDGKTGMGPLTGRQIVEKLQKNEVSLSSVVWKDGEGTRKLGEDPQFKDWLNRIAALQSGSFGAAPQQVYGNPYGAAPQPVYGNPYGAAPQQPYGNPYAASGNPYVAGQQYYGAGNDNADLGDWRARCVKLRWRFRGMWISLAAGLVCPILFMVLSIIIGAVCDVSGSEDVYAAAGAVGLLAFGILGLATIAAWVCDAVFTLMFLYSVWDAIPRSVARTTPGSAIGLGFVPFFNLYWQFVAIRGCALDLNTALDAYASTLARYNVPQKRNNVGLALTFNILTFFPAFALIQFALWIVVATSFKNSAIQLLALRGGASVEELRTNLNARNKNAARPANLDQNVTLDELVNQQ